MKRRTRLPVLRVMRQPKITQSQAARKAEGLLPEGRTMSQSRYWQIEHGEGAPPSKDEKSAIAGAFGCAIGDIEWPETSKAMAS